MINDIGHVRFCESDATKKRLSAETNRGWENYEKDFKGQLLELDDSEFTIEKLG